MSKEGFILSIEGCPYAFSTNGITSITPTHEEWAPSWTLMDNVLVNPTEYVSWNERTLPIEGDLEVDGITFKLTDKYLNGFTLYDGSSFNGNILTDLFTRGTPRKQEYFIQRSVVSVLSGSTPTESIAYQNEILIFGEQPVAIPSDYYRNTRITGSYNFNGFTRNRPIWIEDEAMFAVEFEGPANNIIVIGTSSVETQNGRGWYGTEKKYHRIKDNYYPDIFFKHPLIIKRGVILWRVNDVNDLTNTSIFPIWRGYAQTNPQLSNDGSIFEIKAEHKWNIYKNEIMDYSGFKYNFKIPDRTYTKIALNGIALTSRNYSISIQPDFSDLTLGIEKFTTNAVDAFKGLRRYSPTLVQPALRQRIYELASSLSLRYTVYPGVADPLNTVRLYLQGDSSTSATYNVAAKICGETSAWSSPANNPDLAGITSPVLPRVAIDFKQNVNGYYLKYATINGLVGYLPTNYLVLRARTAASSETSGNDVIVRHIFQSESGDDLIIFTPNYLQADSTNSQNFIRGNITKYNKDTLLPISPTNTEEYIKEALEFKSALSVDSAGTTIETIIKSMLRPRSAATVFNNINTNDFNVTNLEELNDWVSGIEPRSQIFWNWTNDVKFMDYIQPYMKFFNYVICLENSKIKFRTYDPARPVDHTLTSADFLEVPSNLATLPENLFNSIQYKAPNYDTEYVFNDDLSKGRYKVGNTQEVELPAPVGGIGSPEELISYFKSVAVRFLSIWGYPQYVFKCKTSLSKINIELGQIVQITDWLVPDFDPINPIRGLVNRKGLVIERNVDISSGVIEFSIVYQEEVETSFYSPAGRIDSITNDVSYSSIFFKGNYIKPSNKNEPNASGSYGTTFETSDYAGSNRYAYRDRYGITNEDFGVSPFNVNDSVELILRDSTTQNIFSGSVSQLKVTAVDPSTSKLTLNQPIPTTWTDYIASGNIVDIRFANYDLCETSQKEEYGWIGDYTFESLDNPLPTPPAIRQARATQFSP